jgi:hypothetical protein
MIVHVTSTEENRFGKVTQHIIRVKAWNEVTQQYEELWSMVRSEPFTAQVECLSTYVKMP